MKKIILATAISVLSLSAYTFDNGVKISANMDENKDFHPDLELPIRYNKHYSSSIEYLEDSEITENEKVADLDTSDKDTQIDHKLLRINVLNYNTSSRKSKFYFGFGYQKENFDKSQLGFVKTNNKNINFDNNINIEVKSLYLKTDYVGYEKKYQYRLRLTAVPVSKLEVTQDTKLTGTTNSTGKGSSDEDQDLSYDIEYEAITNFNSYINYGLDVKYRYLPLQYSLKIANDDGSYSDTKYDTEEVYTEIGAKIYLDTKIMDLMPTLGVSSASTKTTNNITNESETIDEVKVMFGISSRF